MTEAAYLQASTPSTNTKEIYTFKKNKKTKKTQL